MEGMTPSVLPNSRNSPSDTWRFGPSVLSSRLFAYIYLCIALPTELLLSFLVPPMQVMDESRHFVRACQISQGGWRSELDPTTGRGGGLLPVAVADFVRHWMDTDSLRSEDGLRTILARIEAIHRSAQQQAPIANKKFVEFPSAGVYPPSLYIPQSAGIRTARFFSDKVYVWFYSARVFNAVCAVLLVFLGLRLAPQHQLLLIIPAVLPMSLFQIASISNDASIIALAILFVALCIRYLARDTTPIRIGLAVCLFLLVTGKPVHLVFAVLLLAAYKRLGWRRAASFSSLLQHSPLFRTSIGPIWRNRFWHWREKVMVRTRQHRCGLYSRIRSR